MYIIAKSKAEVEKEKLLNGYEAFLWLRKIPDH